MQSNSVNGQPDIANITVVTDERQVIVPQAITSVVEVNNPGPQGPVGPTGPQGPSVPFTNIGNDVYATTSSLQVTGSFLVSGSSTFTNIGPAVFSGSVNATSGVTMSSALVSGNVTVLGTASINVLQINTTINSTGSNQLGDAPNDTQTLYGTVVVPTGSLTVTGSINATSIVKAASLQASGISTLATTFYYGYLTEDNNSNRIYLNANELDFWTNGSSTMRVTKDTKNILIGTTTDAGYKLNVRGEARISSSLTLDSQPIFRVENGFGANVIDVRGNGNFVLGGGSDLGLGTGLGVFTRYSLRVGALSYADASAILQADSTTRGFLPPRTATTASISSPAQGLITYLTGSTNEGLYYYNSGSQVGWHKVMTATGSQSISGSLEVKVNSASSTNNALRLSNTQGNAGIGTGLVFYSDTTPSQGTFNTGRIYSDFPGFLYTDARMIFQTPTSADTWVNAMTLKGSNVGIGTNTPITTLDVSGSIRIVTTPSAGNVVRPDNVGTAFQFGNGTNTSYGEYRFKSDGGTDLGRFLNTGNFGIGTITPSAKLHISGSTSEALLIASSSAGPTLYVSGSGRVGIGTSTPLYTLDVNGSIRSSNTFANAVGMTLQTLSGKAQLYQAGGVDLAYYDGANVVNGFTIRGTGFVGIGPEMTPAARLHISGSVSEALLRVDSPASSSILYVSGSGFVGVGTNNPVYKLDVSNPTGYSAIGIQTAASTNAELQFKNAAYSLPRWTIRAIAAADGSSGNLTFQRLANTFPMTITSGDNVLVGTSVDSARLMVKGSGTTSASTTLRVENANTSASLVVLDNGTVGINTASPTALMSITGDASYASIYTIQPFNVNDISQRQGRALFLGTVSQNNTGIYISGTPEGSAHIQTFNSSTSAYDRDLAFNYYGGSVGIGKIGFPAAKLHITGSTSQALLVASSSAGPALYVSGSGNVGIGTSTPSENLQVSGSVLIGQYGSSTSLLRFANVTNAGNSAYIGQTAAAGFEIQPGSVSEFRINTPAGSDTNALTIFGNGVKTAQFYRNSRSRFGGNLSTNPGSTVEIVGEGATSSTVALTVQNSNNSTALRVLNDTSIFLGGASVGFYPSTNKGQSINVGAGGLFIGYAATGDLSYPDIPSVTIGRPNNRLLNATSGTTIMGSVVGNYSPTSGTGSFTALEVIPTINQTGGANGITRGIYVNPTLTAAADFRAIETTAGNVLFGTSGTGFFWDNTNSRLGIGIATPAGKLDLYDSTTSLLYVRTGTVGANWQSAGVISQLGTYTNHSFVLKTNDAERMRIVNNGNVLIGTTTDSGYKLDVSGSAQFYKTTSDYIQLLQDANSITFSPNAASYLKYGANTILSMKSGGSNSTLVHGAGTAILAATSTGVSIRSNVDGTAATSMLQVRGSGATNATTTFLLQNSTPTNLLSVLDNGQVSFTSPTMSLAASQSAFSISPIISASNVVGGQYYGVNITPTFFQTTGSQTETAFRVAATFTSSNATATSGSNIIADFGSTSAGSQLTVTDVTSGSIYMVNDVSGIPIIEATSNWDVNIYDFPNKIFEKTGSQVNIYGTMRVSGSFILPLSQSAAPQTGSAYWSGSLLFIYNGTRYMSASFA